MRLVLAVLIAGIGAVIVGATFDGVSSGSWMPTAFGVALLIIAVVIQFARSRKEAVRVDPSFETSASDVQTPMADPDDRSRARVRKLRTREFGWKETVALLAIGAVFLFLQMDTPTSSDRTVNSRSSGGQSSHRTAIPAPADRQPTLNASFLERGYGYDPAGSMWNQRVLTAAGYPFATTLEDSVGCVSPYGVAEALDALRSNDRRWLDTVNGCFFMPAGTQLEWTKLYAYPGLGLGLTEFRMITRDGGRQTIYSPASLKGDQGVVLEWVGTRER